jgi:hypothetical protein
MSKHESQLHYHRRVLRNLAWDVIEAWDDTTKPGVVAAIDALRAELWRQSPKGNAGRRSYLQAKESDQ